MTQRTERALPRDLDAEAGVLGSILLKPDALDDVLPIIGPDDFAVPENGIVFAHAAKLHGSGKTPDPRLLLSTLRKAGELEEGRPLDQVGGESYLMGLFDREPTAANAVYYARSVREAATLRGLIESCEAIQRAAYEVKADGETLLTRAEHAIAHLAERGREQTETFVGDVLAQSLARLPDEGQPAQFSGLQTGYVDLDAKLGGLKENQLVILAGRPSMGKTALAANIAERVSVDCQEPVLFFSLEMGLLEIANRLLFCRAGVPHHKGSSGILTADERRRLVATQTEYSQSKLQLDESPCPTVSQMAATARRVKRKHGLSLIVVDYLQLVSPDNARDPRQEQVAKIARNLKQMAKSLKVPILCLAQLNRQAELGTDHRPRLSHLRESGAIEQDADIVMFCHREEYYANTMDEKEKLKGQAEIIVAKHRNGPTGIVPLVWLEELMRFETAARQEAPKTQERKPAAYTPKVGKEFDPSEHDYPSEQHEAF